MHSKSIICLVGMMGVGKTTIGSRLAKKLGYYFIDSDQEIEDIEAISINEIFATKGEAYFRELEQNFIIDNLQRDEKIVFSLGGGAFINEKTRSAIKSKATSIWLEASIDEIYARLSKKKNRPLINQNQDTRNIIIDLLKARESIYRMADFNIDTGGKACSKIIKEIFEKLGFEYKVQGD